MLKCQICGVEHQTMISPSHIKKHGITALEYKAKFPGSILRVQSAETRAKSSASKKGKTAWNKNIKTGRNANLSAAKKGKENIKLRGQKRSEEQRKNISEKTKLALADGLSAETKSKISFGIRKFYNNGGVAGMTGKTLSTESRAKISASQSGDKNWARAALNEKMKQLCGAENLQIIEYDGARFQLRCQKCHHVFSFCRGYFTKSQINLRHAVGSNICPSCFPRAKTKSNKELEVLEYLRSIYTGEVKSGSRVIISPYELDIYLPDKNIAVEFSGIYWHSENVSKASNVDKHRDYHKMLLCRELGIRLITIFEDEWDNQQQIVKERLAHILSVHPANKKIHARSCAIRDVSSAEKDSFLRKYHIQSTDRAKVLYGAFSKDELVAVMTFSPTNFVKGGDGSQTELNRFALKAGFSIPGIAGKLLAHHRRLHPLDTIISYSDNRWSDGNVYSKLGFTKMGESKPSYFYIDVKSNAKSRIHRSNFMKHRMSKIFSGNDDVNSMLEDGKSEWEIMQHMSYDRIWDCGTTKWMLK